MMRPFTWRELNDNGGDGGKVDLTPIWRVWTTYTSAPPAR